MLSNRDHIQEYFANGFQMVPLRRVVDAGTGKDTISPNTFGKPVLNQDRTGFNMDVVLADYPAFVKYVQRFPHITMMGIYPKFSDYLVLDLDAHDADKNGITNFLEITRAAKLSSSMAAMLQDFPNNWPCWVETPHQGIHLYFKAKWVPRDWDKVPNQNGIDIKYNNQITAAGSIRGDAATTDVNYIMHGWLEDAPQITLDLLDLFTKPKPAPAKPFPNKPKAFAGNTMEPKAKWNETTDGIIEKAREKNQGTTHDFVMLCGLYFSRSGFSFDEALAAVEGTPEHQSRNDKHDTKSCIKSFYR